MRRPFARRHQARRAARAAADRIQTPEGLMLTLRVAGLGVRLMAQLADVLITGVAAICLLIVLTLADLAGPDTLFGLGALMFFAIRAPYYALTELMWNGQTPGKRLMKIKVVAHDGGPLTTHALVVRNLMKEAEVFLPGTLVLTLDGQSAPATLAALAWVGMGFAIPLRSPYRQRLGDILAGTHVVHLPQPVLLPDLAAGAGAAVADSPAQQAEGHRPPVFLAHQLDHYGAFELQTLEGLLRVDPAGLAAPARAAHLQTLSAITERIRRKIGHADPVAPADQRDFLQAFYTAQRAHLEQRQLFGDRRTDKHHADKHHADKNHAEKQPAETAPPDGPAPGA